MNTFGRRMQRDTAQMLIQQTDNLRSAQIIEANIHGSVTNFGNPDIGNPFTLSARQTGFNIFALEIGGRDAHPRSVEVLEHVDIYNCIETIGNLAADKRHRAATRADMKERRAGTERILRHERGIANGDCKPGVRIRCPRPTVLDAESTTACAYGNLHGLPLPVKLECDIAAMTTALDQHAGPLRVAVYGLDDAFLRCATSAPSLNFDPTGSRLPGQRTLG